MFQLDIPLFLCCGKLLTYLLDPHAPSRTFLDYFSNLSLQLGPAEGLWRALADVGGFRGEHAGYAPLYQVRASGRAVLRNH